MILSYAVNLLLFYSAAADIARAIKKLKLLDKLHIVQSVPGELNLDHSTVLQRAEKSSCVSVAMMVTECGWTEMRAEKILVSVFSQLAIVVYISAMSTVCMHMYSMYNLSFQCIGA